MAERLRCWTKETQNQNHYLFPYETNEYKWPRVSIKNSDVCEWRGIKFLQKSTSVLFCFWFLTSNLFPLFGDLDNNVYDSWNLNQNRNPNGHNSFFLGVFWKLKGKKHLKKSGARCWFAWGMDLESWSYRINWTLEGIWVCFLQPESLY